MPTISVIVPVYKVEPYLHRCVDSILAQTFTDFELILVDDGSPDNCPAICDEYAKKDSRVHVIHQKNGGLSAARNAGICVAKGNYLFFADSDDVVPEDCLRQLKKACDEQHADIALGEIKKFKELSELRITNNKRVSAKLYSGIEAINKFLDRSIYTGKYVSSCGKLYKRELFSSIRFPEKKLFEDEFVMYQIYFNAKSVVEINDETYFYFLNDNGITGGLDCIKWCDEYDAQWECIRFLKSNDLDELYKKALAKFLHTAQWNLLEIRKQDDETKSGAHQKVKRLEKEYRNVLRWARKAKAISIEKNIDFYAIAWPRWINILRAVRVLKMVGRRK